MNFTSKRTSGSRQVSKPSGWGYCGAWVNQGANRDRKGDYYSKFELGRSLVVEGVFSGRLEFLFGGGWWVKLQGSNPEDWPIAKGESKRPFVRLGDQTPTSGSL